jgi:hypothetical protein
MSRVVLPTVLLNSEIIQQDATIAFILRNGFTLHVSGDNSTHHQDLRNGFTLHVSGDNSTHHQDLRNGFTLHVSGDNSTHNHDARNHKY